MKNENKKFARLIKQIQRGNQSAFEEFYKLTSPKAYFIALKITQNEHDAEDILQESYIKALEKINEIDTSQNVTSWFLKIVSNKSKDFLKSRNRLVFEGEEETVFDDIPEEKAEFCPEENLNQEELRLEVMAAIDELTAEKRACIMMMYFGDMSVKEIAESIEVPESTVKNRLYTARKDLKTKFEKNGNILYGAALGGVLIWALNKTSVTASAAFLASAASAEIIAGATAAYTAGASATAATATAATTATASSAAATTTATAAATTAAAASTGAAASTAAATGAGVAAKIAALSIAQKVVAGTVAAGVIGGSTAGVATIAKNISPPSGTTTSYIVEEVTTAPLQTRNLLFAWADSGDDKTETQAEPSTQMATEATTFRREPTATFSKETEKDEKETEAKTEEESATKAPSTRRDYSLNMTTSKTNTTTKKVTTTALNTTIPTTAEETTRNAVTTRPVTTKAVTTTKEATTTSVPTTAKPTTTAAPTTTQVPTTTQPPTTTEPATQAPATLIIEVTDFDNNVVATITETVDAGTEITRDYLVSLVSANGYEAMAGVYGDAIGTTAEAGQSYTFTAEL